MKKGPLSNKEKTYIQENYLDTTAVVLAEDMDRSLHMVDKFIEKLRTAASVKETKAQEENKPVKKPGRASDLLARNKERGVVVMTESSSMESDKKNKKPKQPARYREIIHKIKED